MKLFFLFLSIYFPFQVFAGSHYGYVGNARIESVETASKTGPKIVLKIDKILGTFGSARSDGDAPRELVVGKTFPARIDTKGLVLKKGDAIFFHCEWDCTKDGCTDKKWTLLTEEQAKKKLDL